MDNIDLKILSLLQQDGRMTNKEIAASIGLAPSATSERMRRLQENGIIKKFEARLRSDKLSNGLVAFVFVRTTETSACWDTGQKLAEIPEVQEVHNVAGEDCYLLKIRTRDTLSLSRLLREKIGTIDKVESTRTTIAMETFKETCAIPLDNIDLH